jgi:hypothetical protein
MASQLLGYLLISHAFGPQLPSPRLLFGRQISRHKPSSIELTKHHQPSESLRGPLETAPALWVAVALSGFGVLAALFTARRHPQQESPALMPGPALANTAA